MLTSHEVIGEACAHTGLADSGEDGFREGLGLLLSALRDEARLHDARFVMTHRESTDVILSVADLYADIIGSFSAAIDRSYIGRLNVRALQPA
ncbi:hypothetical protein BST11_02020 [Mycobacterium alsense]|uniref:Uncharacterized protein n=1 Tax=Mycobacterium alsense TaxID=324058 RepID=A0ABX3RHS1_9MYCO|nr:hypothetical protein BST11_02020 [Mycobacterium alsense]